MGAFVRWLCSCCRQGTDNTWSCGYPACEPGLAGGDGSPAEWQDPPFPLHSHTHLELAGRCKSLPCSRPCKSRKVHTMKVSKEGEPVSSKYLFSASFSYGSLILRGVYEVCLSQLCQAPTQLTEISCVFSSELLHEKWLL